MLRIALVIGLLGAVGPFAIDMYLPALPQVAADLGTSMQATQSTLSVFFAAFGISQLAYGPLSDQFGRKPPLYVGLVIFLLGTIGCAFAPTIATLLVARVIQGIGAATVMVIPRAIIRDLHTGPAATRLMATVMLVISVSPMLAPLAGSGVMAVAGWRSIFLVLGAAAAFSLALTAFALEETLPPERRVPARPRQLLAGAWRLIRDPQFLGLTFIGGFGMASFFAFLASASFVYTGEFGLSPTGFSLAFALNAIGFFGATQAAASLGERHGMGRVVRLAVTGFAGVSCLLVLVVLAGFGSLPVIILMLLAANAFLGLVIPTVAVMALDPHPDIAGLASSLGGTLQMVTGGLMIVAAGPFFDGTALPMVSAIAIAGILCWLTAQATFGRATPRVA
ncbi:DHA1 family bicyclomycin/chloramphenicol resistance-like MFS transporter [Amaricoccus macauensis]|uniref:Bcr/CflA family efflux transporter n=1 Tax=Amaricoccus macauensis TaxID=57001 RepID=A0A840SSI0_9RHOB|nr:multidrug effflux MFS transporter [Amaricoccus macauensis]MBB5222293.1 DHA1 family bicyclomycin/chloramphenicol resistance-like MFS transporter [Amaricoccus macauensis]